LDQNADMKEMNLRRRKKNRTVCAELLMVTWVDVNGISKNEWGSLEDISATGACLHLEKSIPTEAKVTLFYPETNVTLHYPKGKYEGKVKYCESQQIGYLLGIAFDPGYVWSRQDFRPAHVL
jgi:hypothetical protein